MTQPTSPAGATVHVVTSRLDADSSEVVRAYDTFAAAYAAKVQFCRRNWIPLVHGEMPTGDTEVEEQYFAAGRDEVRIDECVVRTEAQARAE